MPRSRGAIRGQSSEFAGNRAPATHQRRSARRHCDAGPCVVGGRQVPMRTATAPVPLRPLPACRRRTRCSRVHPNRSPSGRVRIPWTEESEIPHRGRRPRTDTRPPSRPRLSRETFHAGYSPHTGANSRVADPAPCPARWWDPRAARRRGRGSRIETRREFGCTPPLPCASFCSRGPDRCRWRGRASPRRDQSCGRRNRGPHGSRVMEHSPGVHHVESTQFCHILRVQNGPLLYQPVRVIPEVPLPKHSGTGNRLRIEIEGADRRSEPARGEAEQTAPGPHVDEAATREAREIEHLQQRSLRPLDALVVDLLQEPGPVAPEFEPRTRCDFRGMPPRSARRGRLRSH